MTRTQEAIISIITKLERSQEHFKHQGLNNLARSVEDDLKEYRLILKELQIAELVTPYFDGCGEPLERFPSLIGINFKIEDFNKIKELIHNVQEGI